ncbi:MAG: hypothetical protein H7235_04115, partial [Bdellovibrionaceae bacterium]|nr:hypothetical protein [Pseudobdellovibrionaceae bacterium]
MRYFLVLLFFVTSVSRSEDRNALPFLNQQQQLAFDQSDQFLIHLGFENFVEQIKFTQANSKSITAVSKLALERSADYLQTINGARDLANLTAVVLLATSKNILGKAEILLIQSIIIQQLLPFPLLTSEPLNEIQIEQIKKGSVSDAIEIKKKILTSRAGERFFAEKLNLIKAYVALLKPAPEHQEQLKGWLDATISDAIIDPYTVQKRQQNRFLGRALIVTLVKYFREQHDLKAEQGFKALLRKHHLYIENYINAYYVTEIDNGELRGVDLRSGDTAFEYSHGQEAFFTSLIIQPQNRETQQASNRYHLNNSVLDAYKFLDDKKYYEILDKKDTYRKLTTAEETLYNDFWNKKYAHGFSHSGHVEVKKDQATEIAVAWIWDIYPEKDKIGPVRIM